jgi:hypothetical protein
MQLVAVNKFTTCQAYPQEMGIKKMRCLPAQFWYVTFGFRAGKQRKLEWSNMIILVVTVPDKY